MIASQDDAALRALYHKSCQLMTVLVIPLAMTIAMFSAEILQIWTRNEQVAENSGPILALLIAGTAINGMVNMPYALQLAHGWTRLAVYSNVVTVTLLVPMLIYMVDAYGSIGAAFVWLVLNTAYVVFNVQITHARFMRGEILAWLAFDVGLPSLAVLVAVSVFAVLMPADLGHLGQAGWILLSLLSAITACVLAAPAIRKHQSAAGPSRAAASPGRKKMPVPTMPRDRTVWHA